MARAPAPGQLTSQGTQGMQPAPFPNKNVVGSGGAKPSAGSRIDPAQIPRPATQLGDTSSVKVFETRVGGKAALPPASTSAFVAVDTGNCSPRYVRPTLNVVPTSADLASNCKMPFALVVQPMALPHPEEEPIEVVDFGPTGPIRCGRCKAYVNPFMKFIDGGRRFTCNFCSYINETPMDYFCPLGMDGRRQDAPSRPELCKGTVEFAATKDYMLRDPMAVAHIFLIDVSFNAVTSGVTAAACGAVASVLADLQGGAQAEVGLATFDKTVHYYSVRPGQQPKMMVVPDVAEAYSPFPSVVLANAQECLGELRALLESLPDMYKEAAGGGCCTVAAIASACKLLEHRGGKLTAFISSLAKVGLGKLEERGGAAGAGGPDKEPVKGLRPQQESEFRSWAAAAADNQVCIDLFVMPRSHIEIATLKLFTETTGGSLYYYGDFDVAMDEAQMFNDLRWNVVRPQALEAVMRVRASQGISVDEYVGAYNVRTVSDIDLPAIDCDKSIIVKLGHDSKLKEGPEASFQCALLYTTTQGERRIRVHTLSLSTSSSMSSLFRGADPDAQLLHIARRTALNLPGVSPFNARDQALASAINILYTYRKFCASSSSAGQLILPEALKLLPLFILAMRKSPALNPRMRLDARAAWCTKILSMPSQAFIPSIYPRLFEIHNLVDRPEHMKGKMPPPLSLSYEKLDPKGVYLLEDGSNAYIWAAKGASGELVQSLLGTHAADLTNPDARQTMPVTLRRTGTPENEALCDLLDNVRRERSCFLRLRIVKHGEPLEQHFFNLLVEDRNQLGMSYVEFLCHIHRQIQNKFH